MRKVISPCMCEVSKSRATSLARAFCEIKYDDGKLIIRGVIGPMSNGGCKGSCGQCTDAIRNGSPCNGWTKEMLDKFCSIWNEWHLNDMRPYCKHQKELGWDKIASTPVTLYHYKLNSKTLRRKKSIKESALNRLCDGMTVALSDDQIKVSKLPYSITLPHEISGDAALYYEPQKSLYPGMDGETEVKTLGWLHPDEHPDGILGKPCPVCGYKYGHDWKTEEVPNEVIEWLFNLPDSPIAPAWV